MLVGAGVGGLWRAWEGVGRSLGESVYTALHVRLCVRMWEGPGVLSAVPISAVGEGFLHVPHPQAFEGGGKRQEEQGYVGQGVTMFVTHTSHAFLAALRGDTEIRKHVCGCLTYELASS